jgi:DNA-directed RNA polymerase subunit RPC12/RpoP
MASSSLRRRADGDLEEGEYVPAGHYSSASNTDDDTARHSLQSPPSRVEEVIAMGWATNSMLPSEECESDDTISDHGSRGGLVAASFSAGGVDAPARPVYSCRVCGKGFRSPKAVDGHMRVHDPHGRALVPVVTTGWAATGRRGKAAVASRDEINHASSVPAVASEPTRRPLPLAFASMEATRTNLDSSARHEQPVANPSDAAVHQQPAVLRQAHAHQVDLQLAPAVPPPVEGRPVPLAPRRREYICKICGKSYPTNQGLGGHAAGHMNRRKEAEAAANPGAAARQERREHKCTQCGKVFPSGVALGGHMRKHYNGPPISNRKTSKHRRVASLPQTVPDVTLSLLGNRQPSHPSPPPAPSRLRLFGVYIECPPAEAVSAPEDTGDIKPREEAPTVQEGTADDIKQQTEAPAVKEGSSTTEEDSA